MASYDGISVDTVANMVVHILELYKGKIIPRDLRLVASRVYKAGVTRPWTHNMQHCQYMVTAMVRSSCVLSPCSKSASHVVSMVHLLNTTCSQGVQKFSCLNTTSLPIKPATERVLLTFHNTEGLCNHIMSEFYHLLPQHSAAGTW